MIGSKLMYIRVSLGLSYQEFSEKLRIGEFKLRKWENNEEIPDDISLAKIRQEFSLPEDYFNDEAYSNVKGKSYEEIREFIKGHEKQANKNINTIITVIVAFVVVMGMGILFNAWLNYQVNQLFYNFDNIIPFIFQLIFMVVLFGFVIFSIVALLISQRSNKRNISNLSEEVNQFIKDSKKIQ